MRKSERIRLLEMEMLRMQFQIEYLSTAVTLLLKENKLNTSLYPYDIDYPHYYY